MATTVYVLTFDAQWIESGHVVRGQQAYPISAPDGTLDMATAIACCQILAATGGTVLYPESEVQIRTFAWDIMTPPLWDDCGVRVY